MPVALVTGGSGFLGELICTELLRLGYRVRVLDLNAPSLALPSIEFFGGDICDLALLQRAMTGADIVLHNVAQVPLAKNRNQFWRVNRDGTRLALEAAGTAGVRKFVYTSSSAVFGVPFANPVTRATEPAPMEDYGRAKLAGEDLCLEAYARGLDISILRPRTILGPTRMGVIELLYDWVSRGCDVPVLGGGGNVYQFVHAADVARACIAAAERPSLGIYHIGAARFGTMRELLENLIRFAGSRSRVKSLPLAPLSALMRLTSAVGLSPLAPYHALMYGRSMYFDISDAERELDFRPQYDNAAAICEGYSWYLANRHLIARSRGSPHRTPMRRGLLAALPQILRLIPH